MALPTIERHLFITLTHNSIKLFQFNRKRRIIFFVGLAQSFIYENINFTAVVDFNYKFTVSKLVHKEMRQ